MSTVLITGAGTGIGNLTARALARAGHRVYASMRDTATDHAEKLRRLATDERIDLRPIVLDVQSEESIQQAIDAILTETGVLDVVVQNAGHLATGYVEAFTAEDIAHLFDINVLGAQRVNRAVLPHFRARRSGTLLYVGSTSVLDVPPFLGPYVASKAAFDVMAQATRYEVAPLGIESVIVMPGPFTRGTNHFPNASRASDSAVTQGYAELEPFVARNLQATNSLFPEGVDPDPVAVADEITRVLALPYGTRPFRTVVDFTRFSVDDINELSTSHIRRAMHHMGYEQLLTVAHN
ncbi:SDR family oxidoreductase [Streptomyces olivaceiscleroticus]|uniref:SDR family oxidoreductase n=1 Tax=Streptomyces olivaceiscleroticus TaxID=68245 RepID=A0ABP3JXU2_9ACTN